MINVCCVCYGEKYKPQYPLILYNMVKRHMTIPFKFICFSDSIYLKKQLPPEIEVRQFPEHNLQGWWNKLQLFHPETNLSGVNFYLDLDEVIVDSLDKFITYSKDDEFSPIRDFGQPHRWFNSSVMKWNNNFASGIIWTNFIKEKSLWMRQQGDQNVITDLITKYYGEKIKTYPDEWTFSYKWTSRKHQKFSESVRTYEQVPGASIAVFHGKPDPHESTQKWVIDSWK